MDPTNDAAAPAQHPAPPPELDERAVQVLDLERRWWRYAGAKEDAVRESLGLSATQYYQVLNTVIDSPAALAHDPVLVQRLRRMRDSRVRGRAAGPARA
ncbi:DUF3263 domain-containing protein [Demequina gelatinilytica]|uniref:DUF3263 domain-containing protein n=1 Tax=Demequina gelatinilytica TaxID=1638980 RepID=UPI000782C68A|nr:DUF3263 domain-containing protein [Demequina gelatinilytica]